jgi:uncharacterized YigZ family protein
MSTDRYLTLSGESTSMLREKASRFIGLAFPIANEDAFKERLQAVQKEHHAARHWCWAYALGHLGEVHRSNDDGEPAGTAGKPILRHLQGAGLTFSAVIVVRYFGGTLLGKGGLVQAYGEAARAAIEQGTVVQRVVTERLFVTSSYAQFDKLRNEIAELDGSMIDSRFDPLCHTIIELPRSLVSAAVDRWTLQGLQVRTGDQMK